MKYKLLTLAAMATLATAQLAAQSRSLAILETPTDARAAAMGNAALISTDRSYLYTNPTAFFATDKTWTASATGVLFPKYEGVKGRLFNANVAAGWKFHPRHIAYLGYRYQGGLTYTAVKDQFETTGKQVSPFEWAIDMGYAYKINAHFSVFATASMLSSYSGRGTYGAAFSVGGNYATTLTIGNQPVAWNVAARVADFGPNVYYSTRDSYQLPTKAEISTDFTSVINDNHSFAFSLGGGSYFLPTDARTVFANVGAEYTLFRTLSLRTGYHFAQHEASAWTCGVGAQYKGFKLDLAYLCGKADTHSNRAMLTLSYDY